MLLRIIRSLFCYLAVDHVKVKEEKVLPMYGKVTAGCPLWDMPQGWPVHVTSFEKKFF